MTFERPIFLLLLLLLPVFWIRLRRMGSRTALALKCAVFAALVVALAGPSGQLPTHRMAVTVVLDRSGSMPRESLRQGDTLVQELQRRNSFADLRLITLAENPSLRPLPSPGREDKLASLPEPGAANGTDLESGLELALSTLPTRGVRRVVLVSDGNENSGHALTAALRAREQGVEVYTVPSGGTANLPVQLESLALPQQVFSGERFTLSLRLTSLKEMPARISIHCQDREIGAAQVQLHRGANPVDIEARINGSGVSLLEVRAAGEGSERVLLSQAVTVSRPHVLYVVGGNPSKPLLETLERADIDVETRDSVPPELPVSNWDAVLLDNYPEHDLPPEEDAALAKYVYAGGGLIYISGESNAQIAEEPHTNLDKLLPVRGDPDTPDKPTAVVLVLDKSQSMTGEKIEMARAAARASLQSLRPTDKVGIISFDEAFQWVVPLQTASDIPHIVELINSINASGSTRIYPPLKAGFEAIRREKVTSRHIILLTDGVSPPGDMPQLLKDASAQHITISTVGVGNDVNREMLSEIARVTRGRSYFVEEPSDLPQVVSGETRKLKASLIEETAVRPVLVRPVEFTDGVHFQNAPKLLGYVKVKTKTGAETILRTDTSEPLLVRWQYGLGRVIAFMSDARSRWAERWVSWDAFGTLWPQMIRDVSSRDRKVRASVRPGPREGEEIVSYDVLDKPDQQSAPGQLFAPPSRITVSREGGPGISFPLEEIAPQHYEARIQTRQRGLYRIVSGSPELPLPETGFYLGSEEMRPLPVHWSLLREISRVTRARVNPTVEQLLDDRNTLVTEQRELWPYFLLLGLVLNFAEVGVRKGFFLRMRARLRGWIGAK